MNFRNIHLALVTLLALSLLGAGCVKQAQINQVNSNPRFSSPTSFSPPTTPSSSTVQTPTIRTPETNNNWSSYRYSSTGSFEFKYPGTTPSIQHFEFTSTTFTPENGDVTLRSTGKATSLYFSTKSLDFNVSIQSLDYQPYYIEKYDSYEVAWANKIDFTKTNEQIASTLLPKNTDIIKIEKLTVDGIQGVRLELHEEPYDYNKVYYIFPKFNPNRSLNLVISTDHAQASMLQEIIKTLTFDKRN